MPGKMSRAHRPRCRRPRGATPAAPDPQDDPWPRDALRATPSARPPAAPRARASRQGSVAIARTRHNRSPSRDQDARRSAQAARRPGHTNHHRPGRGVHRSRQHAARDGRAEHRPAPPGGVVRRGPCLGPVRRPRGDIALRLAGGLLGPAAAGGDDGEHGQEHDKTSGGGHTATLHRQPGRRLQEMRRSGPAGFVDLTR